MSTALYDIAITDKFSKWTNSTDVTLTGPDETRRLFEVIADKNNDKPLKFPLVCIRRLPGYTIDLTGKKPLTFDGLRKESSIIKSKLINAIPITINYQLDVYTRYFQEADDYMRNFIFNIINYPKLEVNIQYNNIDIQHVANILPGREVIDNSNSTQERLFPGQFTRLSFSFSLDDAYLWDIRIKDNKSIDQDSGNIHIIDKATNEVIVESYM